MKLKDCIISKSDTTLFDLQKLKDFWSGIQTYANTHKAKLRFIVQISSKECKFYFEFDSNDEDYYESEIISENHAQEIIKEFDLSEIDRYCGTYKYFEPKEKLLELLEVERETVKSLKAHIENVLKRIDIINQTLCK